MLPSTTKNSGSGMFHCNFSPMNGQSRSMGLFSAGSQETHTTLYISLHTTNCIRAKSGDPLIKYLLSGPFSHTEECWICFTYAAFVWLMHEPENWAKIISNSHWYFQPYTHTLVRGFLAPFPWGWWTLQKTTGNNEHGKCDKFSQILCLKLFAR